MQLPPSLKKSQAFFTALLAKNNWNRPFILLSFFLLIVLLVSFIIPQLNFGRFYGTDGYSHLIATNQMASSKGLSDFYNNLGDTVSDPSDDTNWFNYPFGLWLFGATIAKITGLPPITADFFFSTLFLLIIVGSFYVFSSLWLVSREQKLCATLFLLSMPASSIPIMNYSPSIFIIPLLFITLYIIFKEPFTWKLLPIAWLSMFIIVISHTGTFMFLISFFVVFFLLYCLLWGKFSKSLFTAIFSLLIIYIISVMWFPNIIHQYENKAQMFLLPGKLFETTFNFTLPGDLLQLFYQNLLVEHQIVYVVIISALLFVVSKILIYIHRKTALFLLKSENFPAFILPIQNMSHSVGATPFWLGPVHTIFSLVGFFHLDNKGKCFLFAALLTTLPVELLQASQGIFVGTGALRQISYLMIIIPITATLGFWHILGYLYNPQSKIKTRITSVLWIVVCLMMIITPILVTSYYLPIISGEDYAIEGLKWLGEKGDRTENVVGWGFRPVPVYTNMTAVDQVIESGTETKIFINFLRYIYFIPSNQIEQVNNFRKQFGVKYILSSDKMLRYFGGTTSNLTIDSNPALSKIYSSNDFRIYEVSSSKYRIPESNLADTISVKYQEGNYVIESNYYKVFLDINTPVIKRLGPPEKDLLNSGYITENFKITGTELLYPEGNLFELEDLECTNEIKDNQITYRTVLFNSKSQAPVGTLIIRYTFYPTVIKREYALYNDWIVAKSSPQMNVQYTLRISSLQNQFIIKNDETKLERRTMVYEDSINKNVNIEDFFIHDGDNGIYITFAGLSPQPSSITYSGTIGNNSNIAITQSSPVKPGASFLSTQFISTGSEYVAKKNIQSWEGIELMNYPDGMTPILLTGYPSPQQDSFINEKITTGYAVITDNSIPYTDVINPSINLQEIVKNNITIINSQKTGAAYFYDYATQETDMMSLMNYTNEKGIPDTGFIPDSFKYNLDTITILSNNKIPFIFSTLIDPTMNGAYAKGYRIPQIAYVNSEPTGVVLFPVSYPMSNSLLSTISDETIFLNWKATIDGAGNNDEIVLLIIRLQDIGDPAYTERFVQLFSYAKEKGLTFTSPARIADHFMQLQNISYSGFIDGDKASLNVTNTNKATVRNVTFKVTFPALTNGTYRVNDGAIVRLKHGNNQSILYVNMEIPADSTKNIIIEPDMQRKSFHIEIPQKPIIEGSNAITVKDVADIPLSGVEVFVDTDYYMTDKNGVVHVDLGRGYHTITVQSPGYEKYSSIINVKGRVFIIEQIIGRIF